MNAAVPSNERTVLLLLPGRKEMYPLSTAAFKQAQGSRRELAKDYGDALVLDRDGLRKIETIAVIGPAGESIGKKLLSRLTDAWRIDVGFSEPLNIPLEQIKQLVIDSLDSPKSADSMLLDEQTRQQFVDAIRGARNIEGLFDLLKLPAPDDALDVL